MSLDEKFIIKVRDLLEKYPKNHSSNALRNAFGLLERAKRLAEIDSNASVFLAITAEEEAVSSIFLALKHLRYDCADKLKHHNHVHKSAFVPFCEALSNIFSLFNKSNPQVTIDTERKIPRLFLKLTMFDFNGNPLLAKPDVPFGFTVDSDMPVDTFENALKKYFGEHYQKLNKWLEKAANKRNMVLYASPSGIPKVKIENPDAYFMEYENKLNHLMLLYFLIAPYREKQLFVQQALYAFVKMIGQVPNEDKLMEMIEDIGRAPVGLTVDLNEGKMTKLTDKQIELTANEITFKQL
jgi:hypothetical protein